MHITFPGFNSLRGTHYSKYENYICSLCVAAHYGRIYPKSHHRPSLGPATSQFSTSTRLSGNSYWRQAPTVRRKIWNSRERPAAPAILDLDNQLASEIANLPIIKSAVSSGVIAVSADKAAQILKDFQALPRGSGRADGTPDAAQVAGLCSTHGVKPLLLFILGLLLARGSQSKSVVAKQARKLIHAASATGDASATIYLCSSALQGKTLRSSDMFGPRKHLSRLVEQEHNAQVLVLAGHIASREGDALRALELYEKGVELGKNADRSEDTTENIYATIASHDPSVASGLREGWRCLGELRMKMGDRKGAREALAQGAEMQDPYAFLFLAGYEKSKNKKWFEYVTKAAASGIADATLMLGNFYLEHETLGWEQLDEKIGMSLWEPSYRKVKLQNGEERIETIEHLNPIQRSKMAQCWFEVGAAVRHGKSILALVKWLLEHGQASAAESWMVNFDTCDDEESKREAQKMMAEWKELRGRTLQ